MKWILVGLFAPEVVVYIAWAQRQRVKRLSEDFACIFSEEVSCEPAENIHLTDVFEGREGPKLKEEARMDHDTQLVWEGLPSTPSRARMSSQQSTSLALSGSL